MTESDPQPFDFRKNAALDDTAVSLRNWVTKSSSFLSDFWSQTSDFDVQLSAGQMTTQSYASVLENVSREDYCCIAELKDYSNSLWCASTTDLRRICGEMLGMDLDAGSNSDDLSPVEFALSKMFLSQLANSLGHGWMGEPTVVVQLSELSKDPRKVSAFRSSDLLTTTSIVVEMKSGSASINWLLPKQSTFELLATVVDPRKRSKPASCSAAVVGKLPIEVVIELGRARIPMLELSELVAGKLIPLDQRIDRPLIAYVNNAPFSACWPGKVGKQQAAEVSKLMQFTSTGESDEQ